MSKSKLAALCTSIGMLVLGGSCIDSLPYYKCRTDNSCINLDGQHGRCLWSLYGPFCAFPDKGCATMWRWDQQAHPEIKNECVDSSVKFDAAVDSAIDMSPTE